MLPSYKCSPRPYFRLQISCVVRIRFAAVEKPLVWKSQDLRRPTAPWTLIVSLLPALARVLEIGKGRGAVYVQDAGEITCHAISACSIIPHWATISTPAVKFTTIDAFCRELAAFALRFDRDLDTHDPRNNSIAASADIAAAEKIRRTGVVSKTLRDFWMNDVGLGSTGSPRLGFMVRRYARRTD